MTLVRRTGPRLLAELVAIAVAAALAGWLAPGDKTVIIATVAAVWLAVTVAEYAVSHPRRRSPAGEHEPAELRPIERRPDPEPLGPTASAHDGASPPEPEQEPGRMPVAVALEPDPDEEAQRETAPAPATNPEAQAADVREPEPEPERAPEADEARAPGPEAKPEPAPEPEAAHEPEPEPVPEPEPEPEPAPPPEPLPVPEPAPTPEPAVAAARTWNVWELERRLRDAGGGDEEQEFLLLYLRDFAGPDGALPADFDGLVRESFGDLVEARA
ncbi:MAG TPA: hypothetical protein VFA05_11155 [Gaiellaceae bacterium]|nr:hypothetical protein [Gaiellaceae bacterium]